jgi:hypothetical protein
MFLIVTLVPAIFFMTTHYGTVGAASVWVALNGIYMVIGVPLTHRRLIQGEMGRWFIEDIIPPLTAALVITGIGRWLFPNSLPPVKMVISLAAVLLSALLAAALVASHMRTWLNLQLSKLRSVLT